jgi:hypothetical protein
MTVPDCHFVDDTFYVMTLRDDRFAERHRLKIVINEVVINCKLSSQLRCVIQLRW